MRKVCNRIERLLQLLGTQRGMHDVLLLACVQKLAHAQVDAIDPGTVGFRYHPVIETSARKLEFEPRTAIGQRHLEDLGFCRLGNGRTDRSQVSHPAACANAGQFLQRQGFGTQRQLLKIMGDKQGVGTSQPVGRHCPNRCVGSE